MRLVWALAAPMCDPTYGRRSSHQSLALSVEIIGHSRIPYEASSFNGQLARQRLIVFSAARVWELECPIATAGSVRRVSVRRLARPRCPARPRTVLRRLVASRARARRLSARPAIARFLYHILFDSWSFSDRIHAPPTNCVRELALALSLSHFLPPLAGAGLRRAERRHSAPGPTTQHHPAPRPNTRTADLPPSRFLLLLTPPPAWSRSSCHTPSARS